MLNDACCCTVHVYLYINFVLYAEYNIMMGFTQWWWLFCLVVVAVRCRYHDLPGHEKWSTSLYCCYSLALFYMRQSLTILSHSSPPMLRSCVKKRFVFLDAFWREILVVFGNIHWYLHSLKSTASSPLKIGEPQKRKDCLLTINFQCFLMFQGG